MKNLNLVFVVAGVFVAIVASADGYASERNERPTGCDQYLQIPIPQVDLPSKQEQKELAGCKSEGLYFGFEKPADPVKARQCAYVERKSGVDSWQLVFGSSGLLSMIYANGKGVMRNFDLAIKFACEVDGAPAENFGRFEHLKRLKEQNWTGSNFNLCDDATSGFMQGWCAQLQERFEAVKRHRTLERLIAHWQEDEKAAFRQLEKEAASYFESSSRYEVDLTGTGRGAFEIEARAELEDQFLAQLEELEQRKFPSFTVSQVRSIDVRLNETYKSALEKNADPATIGMIGAEGIRQTERSWLIYREAWVRFGAVKYPKVKADDWRAWVAEDRQERLAVLAKP